MERIWKSKKMYVCVCIPPDSKINTRLYVSIYSLGIGMKFIFYYFKLLQLSYICICLLGTTILTMFHILP